VPVALAPVSWHRTAPGLPCASWRELRAIKINKYLMTARSSWSPSGRTRISSKALRDKDGACKTCGQVGCRPASAQHRPTARSQWFATVRSDLTTLAGNSVRQVATMRLQHSASAMGRLSGTATVTSDVTARRHTTDRVQ
jgi:hypothetical protein